MWVLGIEPGSLRKTASTFNHWTLTPVPSISSFKDYLTKSFSSSVTLSEEISTESDFSPSIFLEAFINLISLVKFPSSNQSEFELTRFEEFCLLVLVVWDRVSLSSLIWPWAHREPPTSASWVPPCPVTYSFNMELSFQAWHFIQRLSNFFLNHKTCSKNLLNFFLYKPVYPEHKDPVSEKNDLWVLSWFRVKW